MNRSAAPFDALAPGYDASFTHQPLGLLLRQPVWRELGRWVGRGDRVLDLGCGSGEDVRWLAARGAQVVAVDRSSAMLATARAKLLDAGLDAEVRWARLDLAELDPRRDELSELAGGLPFRLALADMGPLNCLADRRALGAALWRALEPGGRLVAVVMGPVCAWEIAWHLLHGEARRAFRRLGRLVRVAPSPGEAEIPVFYPSPRQLSRELSPWFRRTRCVAIGAFVPPPYLGQLAERWPRLVDFAAALDRKLARMPPLPNLADHYLVHFERRDDGQPPSSDAEATDPLAAPSDRSLRRRLRRRLLWWRFLATGRRRHGRATRESIAGRPLGVEAGVFNPVLFRTAPVLADAVRAAGMPSDARILDLGTGTGLGALLALAAAPGGRAVAVDVDPRAVRCAAGNAELWGLADRLEAREGDLFAPVAGEPFDVVLFHPPFWRASATPPPSLRSYERAFYAPDELPGRFAGELARHLAPGGFALLILSSDGMESTFLTACRRSGLAIAVLFRRDLGSEVMSVYRLRARLRHGDGESAS